MASMSGLTPEERETAIGELERSRQNLLAAVEGLSDEQWRSQRSERGWSIADCAEHIAAAEMPLERFFASGAREQPSEQERREIRGKDDYVRRFLRDRSQKGESPERIRPKGRFATPQEAIKAFEERRRENIAYVRGTREPLRDRFGPHPFAGVIDGYQWVLFLAAHCDRHAAQIQEIRKNL
jgi:DinB family protein